MVDLTKPLIVQSDRSLLLEVHAPGYQAARDDLARFAELEKSPEHVHTYRITPLSLWNAAAAGSSPEWVIEALRRHAKYGVADNVLADVRELMSRFGKLRLIACEHGAAHELEVDDDNVRRELLKSPRTAPLLRDEGGALRVDPLARGTLKQQVARLGYPIDDRVGFADGERLELQLRQQTSAGRPFALRPFQREASRAFVAPSAGHGVVVLPCGAGKTMVGMAAMAELGCATLILCTNITAVRQWIAELCDKTTLARDQIGEYSGKVKQIRPVTVATYQIVSRRRGDELTHFGLFSSREWGLIVYDEVHLLPAPVFRVTAELQARRRLGLTATLIREDGLETDVFSLIGPKRFDVPWKELEATGFIAEASCHEIRVPMSDALRVEYAAAADEPQRQHRLAAENHAKLVVAEQLATRHAGEGVLVIGMYVQQLEKIAHRLGAPLITGKTPQARREELFARFRRGEEKLLVVSKVANFSLDLPDASVCIQVSGTFGSRQEEAQRLGRILRPKKGGAVFYSLVSRDSSELRFAMNRQLFLTEQGYRYYVEDHEAPHAHEDPEDSTAAARPPEPALADVIPISRKSRERS